MDTFAAIVERVNVGLAAVTLSGRFTFVNDRYCEITGRSRRELLQLGMQDITHPDDLASNLALFARCVDEGHNVTIEKRYVRPDGSQVWVENHVSLVRSSEGAEPFIVAASHEITAKQRAHEALSQSEERFRAFVTASSDVVYRMSPDWSEMRHLRGRDFIPDTPDPSRTWMDKYILPEDQPHVRAAIQKAISTKNTFELEHRVIRVDGTVGWTFSRAIPLLDAQGEIVEWFGAARDITERKRSDEAVARLTTLSEQQRRLYETILSSTPDLVYVFGLDHRFTYANDALLTMWGKTWDEARGKNCLELGYEPWHAAMHDREIEEVIATKRPIRGDVPFTGTHGRRIYDYIFVPVFGTDGEVEAIAGTTRDVTDRKLAEDALRQSEDELRRANQLKDEFLAILSHELRTPLNAILGWAHMIGGDGVPPSRLAHAVRTIQRNARAQAQMVEDLLDISAVVRGKLRLQIDPLDLAAVVNAAVDGVRPTAEQKDIRLYVTQDPGAREIWGDAGRLQQVLWNLLSNALKFTPEGGRVDVEVRASSPDRVQVVVRDTGRGIDPGFLPYVFDRFRQADSTTTRAHGGLGLGLSIVRYLVEAHGGSVMAQSEGPHRGSAFIVTLPVRSPADVASATTGSTFTALAPSLKNLRVLFVDDDPDARELTAMVLTDRGAHVTTAASVREALRHIEHAPPDVLIADIGMPDQDGYALIRAVRRLPPSRGGCLPAVALTAFASVSQRQEALAAGFDRHVAKPVEPDKLTEVVAGLFQAR